MNVSHFFSLGYSMMLYFLWGYCKWDFSLQFFSQCFRCCYIKIILYLHLYPGSICWLCLSVVGIFRWCLLCLEFNCLQIGVPWLLFLFYFLFYKHYKLNKSRKSRHPCPVPDFKDNASSFSLFSMTFAVILWCSTFIVLKCISCITRFSRFCHKRLIHFVLFFTFIEMTVWLLDMI